MNDVADLAQLVEQLIRNEQVVGSNPIISSIEIQRLRIAEPFFVFVYCLIGNVLTFPAGFYRIMERELITEAKGIVRTS